MANTRDFDHLFKLVLIGEASVGKTALLLRFADSSYDKDYISTVGVDFRFRTVSVDSKLVKLQIWDTAGQERFRTITSAYYRGAHGVILVYDISKRESFDRLQTWVDSVNEVAGEKITKLVVGNKADLVEKRQVLHTDGQEYATSIGAHFIETSAKTGANVDKAFVLIAKQLVAIKNSLSKMADTADGSNELVTEDSKKTERKCCCTIL